MGRRRIPIKAIKDPKTKQLTFMKRLEGLLKKTMELSILCDSQICLLVMGQGGEMLHYGSIDPLDLCRQYDELRSRPELLKAFEAHPHLTNHDYGDIFVNQQHARALSRDRLLSVPQAFPPLLASPSSSPSPSPSPSSSSPHSAPPSAHPPVPSPTSALPLPSPSAPPAFPDPSTLAPLSGLSWAAPHRRPLLDAHDDAHWSDAAPAPGASGMSAVRGKRKLNIDIPYPTHMSLPEGVLHGNGAAPPGQPASVSPNGAGAAAHAQAQVAHAQHGHLMPQNAAFAHVAHMHAPGHMAGAGGGAGGGTVAGGAVMGGYMGGMPYSGGLASPSAGFTQMYWNNAIASPSPYSNFFSNSGMLSPTSLGLGAGALFGVSPDAGKRIRTFEGGEQQKMGYAMPPQQRGGHEQTN